MFNPVGEISLEPSKSQKLSFSLLALSIIKEWDHNHHRLYNIFDWRVEVDIQVIYRNIQHTYYLISSSIAEMKYKEITK